MYLQKKQRANADSRQKYVPKNLNNRQATFFVFVEPNFKG
jgi:hypothetical protein